MKYGNVTRQEALEGFAYGSDPVVKAWPKGHQDYPKGTTKGFVPVGDTTVLFLRGDIGEGAEEALSAGQVMPPLKFRITLLHEMVHWANNEHGRPTRPNGRPLRGELGRRFEREVFRRP